MNNKTINHLISTAYWIVFFMLVGTLVVSYVYALIQIYPIKATLDNFDKIISLNQDYKISWLYSCPDYVHNYYNCQDNLKFMNITGKYCNNTLVCENKYILSNKT